MVIDVNKVIRTHLASLLPTYCESISDSDDLRLLGLDSLRFVELVISLEDTLQAQFPDDKLSIMICNSVQLIADAISISE